MTDAKKRPLQLEEIAAGRRIEQFVRDRLDAGMVLTIVVLTPDGERASIHMACNPPMEPDAKAVMDAVLTALKAAREDMG